MNEPETEAFFSPHSRRVPANPELRNGRGPQTPRLLAERISQLAGDFGRDDLIMHTVMVGKLAFRHPEGAVHYVPQREGAGEIGLSANLLRGVVPAVEYR